MRHTNISLHYKFLGLLILYFSTPIFAFDAKILLDKVHFAITRDYCEIEAFTLNKYSDQSLLWAHGNLCLQLPSRWLDRLFQLAPERIVEEAIILYRKGARANTALGIGYRQRHIILPNTFVGFYAYYEIFHEHHLINPGVEFYYPAWGKLSFSTTFLMPWNQYIFIRPIVKAQFSSDFFRVMNPFAAVSYGWQKESVNSNKEFCKSYMVGCRYVVNAWCAVEGGGSYHDSFGIVYRFFMVRLNFDGLNTKRGHLQEEFFQPNRKHH